MGVARQRAFFVVPRDLQGEWFDACSLPAMQWGSESDRDRMGLAPQRLGNPRARRPFGWALLDTETVQIALCADSPVLCCAEGRRLAQSFAEACTRHATSIAKLQGQQIWKMWQVSGFGSFWQGAVHEGACGLFDCPCSTMAFRCFCREPLHAHACACASK